MIEAAIGIAIGVAIALSAIAIARALRWQHWYYSATLILLPLVYGAFALGAGAGNIALNELLLGIPFLVVGTGLLFRGMRRSAILVGCLWLSHGAYDLVHDLLLSNPGVPSWYPALCAGFDLSIGSYVLWLSRTLENADIRLARG